MDDRTLIQWYSDPLQMDRDSVEALRNMVETYPCFAAARMLYAKGLSLLNDLRFPAQLEKTAISVPDRNRLFEFVERSPCALDPEQTTHFETASFGLIDRFLENSSSDSAVLPDLDYVESLSIHPTQDVQSAVPAMSGQAWIDAYLEKSHVRTPLDAGSGEDHSLTDLDAVEGLPEAGFTETLAQIYIKQKRFDRALEIIQSLRLKYPEKNVYFADQIRFLEKLITNTKNK